MNLAQYCFVACITTIVVVLTYASPQLRDSCTNNFWQDGEDPVNQDMLPKCKFLVSNESNAISISYPAPGIVRVVGEYNDVRINCSAPYPLDFRFNGTKPSEAIKVTLWRTVKENSMGEIISYHADVIIYSIRALHRLYSDSNPDWTSAKLQGFQYSRTGGYIFRGFHENSKFKTALYIFFEEELTVPTFITNRRDRKAWWNQHGRLVIPCRPTHFNSLVSLKQETNQPVIFTYSVTGGFVSTHRVSGLTGTYFCKLQDRGNGTSAKYEMAGTKIPYGYHVRPVDYNVDIQYNVTALENGHSEIKTRCRPTCGTFDCGSNETAVLASISVANPPMDNLLNDFVLPLFRHRSYTVRCEKVQQDINHEIRFKTGFLDYVAATYCGNRDRSKKTTFGKTLTGIVYPFQYGQEWTEVDRDRAEITFYLKIWHNRLDQELYENEDIIFYCRIQTFVLAPPSIWYFEWENNTITEEFIDYNWSDGLSILPRKLSTGLQRVYCAGSIWHRTFWRDLSMPINVLPSSLPYFKYAGNPIKRFVSSLTYQYLKCTAFGGPKPTITWEHKGEVITAASQSMDYSLLHFDEINATVEGVYICKACNVVGCRFKTYTVEVFSDTTEAPCSTDDPSDVQGVSVLTYATSIVVLMVSMVVIVIKTRLKVQSSKGLSKQELNEFFKGEKSSAWTIGGGGGVARSRPYDPAFEIDKRRFKVERHTLGKGEFGVVYRGSVDKQVVAVKTIKRGSEKQYLKVLLSELKIMIYLGRHKNLVELVGAYTGELQIGRLYIFLKFCKHLSLDSYLRENRKYFHTTKPNYISFNDMSTSKNIFTILDLFKWAIDVAEGMEYLSSTKVVHKDLAARNVLLDESRTAKVTDYGLSRRMYGYNADCLKKRNNDEPLPLWWMALESILDAEYSTKSDVWSYGVTLWEIFSLGNIPHRTPCSRLVSNLKMGKRLSQPVHASDRLYDEIMRKCWHKDASERPSFGELIEKLKELPKNAASGRVRTDSSGSDHNHYSHDWTEEDSSE